MIGSLIENSDLGISFFYKFSVNFIIDQGSTVMCQ